jgi:hypothetical protein
MTIPEPLISDADRSAYAAGWKYGKDTDQVPTKVVVRGRFPHLDYVGVLNFINGAQDAVESEQETLTEIARHPRRVRNPPPHYDSIIGPYEAGRLLGEYQKGSPMAPSFDSIVAHYRRWQKAVGLKPTHTRPHTASVLIPRLQSEPQWKDFTEGYAAGRPSARRENPGYTFDEMERRYKQGLVEEADWWRFIDEWNLDPKKETVYSDGALRQKYDKHDRLTISAQVAQARARKALGRENPMANPSDDPINLLEQDRSLRVGQEVLVRWGYGGGFRAHGRGVITKLYDKSVRVKLLEDVMHGGTIGWPAGFVLKGIPRFGTREWVPESSVTPLVGAELEGAA